MRHEGFSKSYTFRASSIQKDFQKVSVKKSFSPSLTLQRYFMCWDETVDEVPITSS